MYRKERDEIDQLSSIGAGQRIERDERDVGWRRTGRAGNHYLTR
jgi:hypothetical protein